nr:phage GP46 family protein [Escherichia coli]
MIPSSSARDCWGRRLRSDSSINHRSSSGIRECLQWMIDDGVVSRIDLDIRRTGINELGNSITLWRRDGPVMISFDDLWSAITHGGQ